MLQMDSKLFSTRIEVAVPLDCNPSRRLFLGQVVNFDLLLCTGFHSGNCGFIMIYSESESEAN